MAELTDSDFICDVCGHKATFMDCERLGTGWLYKFHCYYCNRDFTVFKP